MLRVTTSGLARARRTDGTVRAACSSLACLLRSIPLLFRAVPATPLRVLCIVALDTIHRCRHSVPLSRRRRDDLSILLDFQAHTNAVWDGKPHRPSQFQALEEQLDAAGLSSWVREYRERLRHLETGRPTLDGGVHRVDAVRAYREAVVRLSLATVAGIALHARHVDEAVEATHADADVAALFHMAMQCQVIDDVLDYAEDHASGLPGFMTAAPLPHALASTACAVRSYGRRDTQGAGMLPLRLALRVLTTFAALAVRAARWTYDEAFWNDTGRTVV